MTVAPFHFDRTARVQVVPAVGPGIYVNPQALVAGGVGPPELRVAFDVKRSISANPNTAEVRVYNLSKPARNRAEGIIRRRVDFSNEFAFIDGRLVTGAALGGSTEIVETSLGFGYLSLQAGYDGVAGAIFEGGTSRVHSRRVGELWETTIKAGDGELGLQKAIANKSFASGTPTSSIVAYLVRTMGLTPTGLATLPPSLASSTSSGVVCTGRARDVLDYLLAALNLEWFVDNGEFWVLEPGGVLPVPPIPVVLVYDRPEQIENGGLIIRVPLESRYRPGAPVSVLLPEFAGQYRVAQVRFRGDNRGGRFDCTVELENLSPVAGF